MPLGVSKLDTAQIERRLLMANPEELGYNYIYRAGGMNFDSGGLNNGYYISEFQSTPTSQLEWAMNGGGGFYAPAMMFGVVGFKIGQSYTLNCDYYQRGGFGGCSIYGWEDNTPVFNYNTITALYNTSVVFTDGNFNFTFTPTKPYHYLWLRQHQLNAGKVAYRNLYVTKTSATTLAKAKAQAQWAWFMGVQEGLPLTNPWRNTPPVIGN